MQRHHVGVPGEGLAAEGVVHGQPLARHAVQELLPPDAGHRAQQLGEEDEGGVEMSDRRPARALSPPGVGSSGNGAPAFPPPHPTPDPHHRTQPQPARPLTEGTSGESVRVRPSRSAARLADTAAGGDTGWMLGGATVGQMRETSGGERPSGTGLDWAGLKQQTVQHHGQRAPGNLETLSGDPPLTPAPHLVPSQVGARVPSAPRTLSPEEPNPEHPRTFPSHRPGSRTLTSRARTHSPLDPAGRPPELQERFCCWGAGERTEVGVGGSAGAAAP